MSTQVLITMSRTDLTFAVCSFLRETREHGLVILSDQVELLCLWSEEFDVFP